MTDYESNKVASFQNLEEVMIRNENIWTESENATRQFAAIRLKMPLLTKYDQAQNKGPFVSVTLKKGLKNDLLDSAMKVSDSAVDYAAGIKDRALELQVTFSRSKLKKLRQNLLYDTLSKFYDLVSPLKSNFTHLEATDIDTFQSLLEESKKAVPGTEADSDSSKTAHPEHRRFSIGSGGTFECCISICGPYIQQLYPANQFPNSSFSPSGSGCYYQTLPLKNIKLPTNLVSIGKNAFKGCTELTSISIPNKVISIELGAFYGCNKLSILNLPSALINIKDDAFGSCSSLKSLTIPNSVTTIGKRAFSDCTELTNLTLPNSATKIEVDAFKKCTALKSLTIPSSFEEINGFAECTGITSLTIPSSLIKIGPEAFRGCTSLTYIIILIPLQILELMHLKIV